MVTAIWRDSPPRSTSSVTLCPTAWPSSAQLDIVGVLHRLAAELDQDVADQHAGLGRGSRRFQRKYDQTFVMIGKLHRLQADAQIAARHVSARQDLVHHAIHRHGGNGQSGDARERAGGDADRLARRC